MARLDAQRLNEIFRDAFPDHEVPRVEEVHDGDVVLSLDISPRHGRPGGTVSGPTMMTLADTAAWAAILAELGEVLLAVTTSLHIDFLRKPSLDADLLAHARLLKLGQRLGVVEVELHSRGVGQVVAKAQVTYSLPPGHGGTVER